MQLLRNLAALLALPSAAIAVRPSAHGRPSAAVPSAAPAFTPLHHKSGPLKPVPSTAHPPFSWPPAGSYGTPACNKIQHDFPAGTNSNSSRADAVKAFYEKAWADYKQYCFGQDDINPVSNTCDQDLFGWGATIVDGIDTAVIMNLTEVVKDQLAWIAKVDFT